MTCKDCNDTRLYQPLIGSPEPCLSCAKDTGIRSLYPLDQLIVLDIIPQINLNFVMAHLIREPKLDGVLKITKTGEVVRGSAMVLALRLLREEHPSNYQRLILDDQVPVTFLQDNEIYLYRHTLGYRAYLEKGSALEIMR